MMKKHVDVDDWLEVLNDPKAELTINTCRCDVMKASWCIPLSKMREHLLFLVESGELNAQLNGKDQRIGPGTFVWLPPGNSRILSGENDQQHLRYYKMRFNILSNDNEQTLDRVFIKPGAWELLPLFRMLVAEYAGNARWRDMQLRNELKVLATSFFRLPGDGSRSHALSAAQRAVIEDFIASNLDHHISSVDLAGELRLSQDYFSRLFVREFGEAPRNYIKRARIRYAMNRLVETQVSIKELAAEMGYNNINLFCRQFKEVARMSPTQYRRGTTA